LLHVIGYDTDWSAWLNKAGATDVNPVRGQQFDATMMALQAAEGGGGWLWAGDRWSMTN